MLKVFKILQQNTSLFTFVIICCSSFRNIMTVRSFHTSASKEANCIGFGNITQRDMVLTQFVFIGIPLLSPHLLGLARSEEGMEGLVHFWRVIGYLLGIQDK